MKPDYSIEDTCGSEAYYALEELAIDPIARIQKAAAYLDRARIEASNAGHKAIEARIKKAESYLNQTISILLKNGWRKNETTEK